MAKSGSIRYRDPLAAQPMRGGRPANPGKRINREPIRELVMASERESALLTDLYQINMVQAYLDHGDTETAVFEFFVRTLPASGAAF